VGIGDAEDQAAGALFRQGPYGLSRYVGAGGEEFHQGPLDSGKVSGPGNGQIFLAEVDRRQHGPLAVGIAAGLKGSQRGPVGLAPQSVSLHGPAAV